MIRKFAFLIFFLFTVSLSFAQNASDYFPTDLGHVWKYKILPLDSLGNPIEEAVVYEIDSLVSFDNFYGRDSYLQLAKIGSAVSINQQQFNDSLFINFDGAVSNVYFNSILNSLSEGAFDFTGDSYSDWLPLYDFLLSPGQSVELFRLDSTITIDSVEIPSRITVESKRLQDEVIETELGQFSTKKFEISFNYYYLLIIPIKLFSLPEVFWFAPDNWLVKEKRETINIDLSQFDIPPFYIPGSQKDIVSVITDVKNTELHPNKFSLLQNYPNPFNPSTNIRYEIPKRLFVQLKIFNVLGQEIASLVNKNQDAGTYEVNFNSEFTGGGLPSGIYIYRIHAGNFSAEKKMILLK